MGRGLGSNPFEISIAIFGPKCGKTHYVALKIPVSLWSSASKIEKYSAFSMYSEPLPRNVYTKQDGINKMYKFYKGTFTDFVCYLFVCLWMPTLPNNTNQDRSLGSFSIKIIINSPIFFGSTTVWCGVVHDFCNFWKHYSNMYTFLKYL